MSISTQGGEQRRPSVVSTGKRAPTGKGASKAAARPNRSSGSPRSSGGPRKPITPVKVSQGRNWGPIGLFVAVGVLAAAIIGWGAFAAFQGAKSWQDKAGGVEGLINYRETNPALLQSVAPKKSHAWGPVQYDVNPPVGGRN